MRKIAKIVLALNFMIFGSAASAAEKDPIQLFMETCSKALSHVFKRYKPVDVRDERLNRREPGDLVILRARQAILEHLNDDQKLQKIVWIRDEVKPVGEGYDEIRQLQVTEFQLLPSKQKFLVKILVAPFALDRRLNVLGVVEQSEVIPL